MKSLSVTTFNIQHGRNHNLPGDVIDLPLMAKNASETGASVIGFNEVRRGTSEGIPGLRYLAISSAVNMFTVKR